MAKRKKRAVNDKEDEQRMMKVRRKEADDEERGEEATTSEAVNAGRCHQPGTKQKTVTLQQGSALIYHATRAWAWIWEGVVVAKRFRGGQGVAVCCLLVLARMFYHYVRPVC